MLSGTYKSTEDETFIDVGFDINGTKHLDASLGYTRKKFNHGYTYNPKVHLTINNERVAAISGTLNIDFNFKFYLKFKSRFNFSTFSF